MALCHMLASSRGVVLFFSFLFTVVGIVMILTGFLVMLDNSIPHILHLLSPPAEPRFIIISLAYLLFLVGCGLILLAALGCCTLLSKPSLVALYLCIILALDIIELVAIVATLSCSSSMLANVKDRLTTKLVFNYGHKDNNNINMYGDNVFTQSMDHAQYMFHCCGVTGGHEYSLSRYFNVSQLSKEPRNVPITCCNRSIPPENNAGSPLSVVSRVFHGTVEEDWQNPHIQNEQDCQQNKTGALYAQGCLGKIEDWLISQSMWFIAVLLTPLIIQMASMVFFIGVLRRLCRQPRRPSNQVVSGQRMGH